MTNSCPDCGTAMDFEQREVRLRTGICPACAKEFAFVEGGTVASRLGSPPAASGSDEGGGAEEKVGPTGPECEECGSPLSFRPGRNGALEVHCEECETMTVFVPQSHAEPRGFPRSERRGPSRAFDQGMPRGRPCRKCGNPIQFSTGEDGVLVGECSSCGNRFTLAPRPEGRGGGRRFDQGPRYGRSEFRRGPREPSRRPFRGPPRDSSSRDEDRDRRRRRRRSDDE